MIDVTKLSASDLQNLIDNHRRLGATAAPLYVAAMTEFHARNAPQLRLDVSLAYLRKAAAARRFVSYGELAEANGASWQDVRYPMIDHLWVLVDHAHRQGWPVLSAIVVNKTHLSTGDMDDATLEGFSRAARALGYHITDERAFLNEQQEACFAWGNDKSGKARFWSPGNSRTIGRKATRVT